jgi:hypothetical protein
MYNRYIFESTCMPERAPGAESKERKNLSHAPRKSGASAPLSDRIFLALSEAEG